MKHNKKVIFKNYVDGSPQESDMEIVSTDTVSLKVPEGSNAVLLKNLYLSCDPFLRVMMSKHEEPKFLPEFVPGSVLYMHTHTHFEIFHIFHMLMFCLTLYMCFENFFCMQNIKVLLMVLFLFFFFCLKVMTGFGVGKVLDSGHSDFKVGDLVWGTTGWEQYSLITSPEELFKIKHTDLPLSYYVGILGELCMIHFVIDSCFSS